MKQYNWILVKNMAGEDIKVRQRRAYGDYFVDEQGNEYESRNIDFTGELIPDLNEQNKKPMDANSIAIADHKAKIDEREYWRKLRVEIFASLRKEYRSELDALNQTDFVIKRLYAQDQEFFKDKDND